LGSEIAVVGVRIDEAHQTEVANGLVAMGITEGPSRTLVVK